MKEPLLLYLQVPFCATRCAFCRCVSAIPNSVLLNRSLHDDYVDALVRNIRHHVPRLAQTHDPIGINWGGGTPTLLSPEQIRRVAAAFGPEWTLGDRYFSVEATVDSLSDPVLAALRDAGVNRLSIGVESFNERTVRQMGRRHSVADGLEVFDRARAHGFDRLNIDLVIGYPGESVAETMHSVRTALSLDLPHIAAYVYSPVANSPLVRQLRDGRVRGWDAVDYDIGLPEIEDALTSAGYRNHEYFHWTRPPHEADFVSLDYYLGNVGDTFGFGSGAYSFLAPRGCLATKDMPDFLADPVTMVPGPVTLDLAVEKALGCARGLSYSAMARMFGTTEQHVREHPVARALAELPAAEVHDDGVRMDRHEYVRQYVGGIRQRMLRLVPAAAGP
jgi:coproporphyrinogen III oxidase-like Fe-S oxidoreductase